jgi:hypothetical protein
MNISGRSLRAHIRLLTPLFGVIAAVWILRGIVGAIPSAPSWLVFPLSVSIAVPVCIILATLLIHLQRFGGYTSVVLSTVLLVVWGQVLVVLAILAAIFTGIDNIYTIPEYSVPNDPNHTRHILGHLTIGIGLESIVGSLMGCLILFMLRRTSPRSRS